MYVFMQIASVMNSACLIYMHHG